MKLQSLKTLTFLAISLLTPQCAAGPLVLAVPTLLPIFGMAASTCWFGGYVVVNTALYVGAHVAAGTIVAGTVAGGAAAGSAAGDAIQEKIEDDNAEKAAASSASMASISSASSMSVESVLSVSRASRASVSSEMQIMSAAAVASAEAQAEAARTYHDPANAVYTFSFDKRQAPPPPAAPVSTLAPGTMPPGVPPGVPEYNFRMCQNDLIAMGTAKQDLIVNQPEAQSKYQVGGRSRGFC